MYLAYTFEEIMAYHPDNKDVYSEIKKKLSNLVPFVGAGLTRFAYHSWKDALNELAGKITNRNNSRQVKEMIRNRHYMDAAQQLENLRTPSNLARDIANLFSSDHLTNKMDRLPKEAVSLLPWLFQGLVLTTNFDETLETVYRECGCPFQTVSHPGHPVLEQFIRNQNQCGLFKMHGTVTGDFIEYENIVFTSAQYNRHYGKDSPLIHDLKACFGKRLMFFLGCSLEMDRTMDILQGAIIKGVNHYAIIGCRKSEKDEKASKLGEKYIRVILYEQGRHEAVRVILEHLLEETRPDIYQKIRPVGALKSSSLSSRFSYDAGIVPLSGRKKELGELNSFLKNPDIPFQWWVITGPGGCGKSRLAYEFQNHLPPGWLARYLKQSDYKNLHGMTSSLTQKTLLIADYVQEHARELGEWMESLNGQPRSLPIRILLVERETSIGPENSAWTKQLYSDVHNEIKLKETCYRMAFLRLSPLLDQDLLDIMENYVSAMQGHKWKTGVVLTNKIKQILLQKLKAIDPDLCRPLYAMFLADAYVDSNDIEQWKRKDILDYVISRERKMLQFRIRNVMHTDIMDQKLYNACVYLQCVATVHQDVPVENLPKLFPDIWRIIESKSEYFESPADFLYQIGLVVKENLFALRPDLVGEYYVYDWLFQNHQKTIQDFIFSIWKNPNPACIFFGRLFDDFGYLLDASPELWDILLPDNIHLSRKSLSDYAMLVSNAILYCNIVEQCEKLVDLLEKFVFIYPDLNELGIELCLANGLYNLSIKQNEQDAERTVARLEKLYRVHSNMFKIEVYFAKGLFMLAAKQDKQKAEKIITRLEKLFREHSDEEEIAVDFANGLYNLTCVQDEQSMDKTVACLERLSREHSDVAEITTRFAHGMVNLIAKQDEQKAEKTVAYLEKLYREHSDIVEITVYFAHGMFNLIIKQDEQKAEKTIARLEKLYREHSNVLEIAIDFADGLFNLVHVQDEQNAEKTIMRLERLSRERIDVVEITTRFAGGLVMLASKQDKQKAERTVTRLEKLFKEHSDKTEIAIKFANGLYNLSCKQDKQGVERTVARLWRISREYSDVVEITIFFATGLLNLSCIQNERDAVRTVVYLERLFREHPNVEKIVLCFARGLVRLTLGQNEQNVKRIIAILERLLRKYTDVTEIAILFAYGLTTLCDVQDESGAERTITRLERLLREYPNVAEIAACFVASLFNLSFKQNEQDAMRTVARLKMLSKVHMNVEEIAAYFSNGLFCLSCEQEKNMAIARLERLSIEHTDMSKISSEFVKVLINL